MHFPLLCSSLWEGPSDPVLVISPLGAASIGACSFQVAAWLQGPAGFWPCSFWLMLNPTLHA